MKTILHPDYWVEVPAGEYFTGLSDEWREYIRNRVRTVIEYDSLPLETQQLLDQAAAKFHQYAQDLAAGKIHSVGLSDEEQVTVTTDRFYQIMRVEQSLTLVVPLKKISLNRFYISRFPVADQQYGLFRDGMPATDLPGVLEIPYHRRDVAAVSSKLVKRFCREISARLPTGQEWEKAARGVNGRLYPWGNSWDPEAGDFFYGQPNQYGRRVDAYSRGVSPYGVWFMAGGLPELVKIGEEGTHARESSRDMAWFDHMTGFGKGGDWVSFRPVLDKWPEQRLSGFQAGLAEPNAAALQKMGPLADLLLTQYNWSALETKLLDTLEPAIVAVREARKLEAQELLAEILHNNDTIEAAWLLQAAALADVPRQRECVQRALALYPESEVGQKLAALLKEPPRVEW